MKANLKQVRKFRRYSEEFKKEIQQMIEKTTKIYSRFYYF